MQINPGVQSFPAISTASVTETANSSSTGYDAEAVDAAARAQFEQTQSKSKPGATKESVIADFQDYMKKTPAERMRAQILGELGMTEEEIAALPAAERRKVEEKIAAMMRERFEESTRKQLEKAVNNNTNVTPQIGVPSETYATMLSSQEIAQNPVIKTEQAGEPPHKERMWK